MTQNQIPNIVRASSRKGIRRDGHTTWTMAALTLMNGHTAGQPLPLLTLRNVADDYQIRLTEDEADTLATMLTHGAKDLRASINTEEDATTTEDKAEILKWKRHSRQWEARAKKYRDELDHYRNTGACEALEDEQPAPTEDQPAPEPTPTTEPDRPPMQVVTSLSGHIQEWKKKQEVEPAREDE